MKQIISKTLLITVFFINSYPIHAGKKEELIKKRDFIQKIITIVPAVLLFIKVAFKNKELTQQVDKQYVLINYFHKTCSQQATVIMNSN